MVPRMTSSAPGMTEAAPPPSATSGGITVTAYAVAAAAMVVMGIAAVNPMVAGLTCLLLIVTIIAGGDLLIVGVNHRASAGLTSPGPINIRRIVVKLFAFAATLAAVSGIYLLLLPLAAPKFAAVLGLLPIGLAIVALSAPLYFAAIDRRMVDPQDGYWHVGQMLLGRFNDRDWPAVRTYALGWTIKGFFLPIMAAAFFSVSVNLGASLSAGHVAGIPAAFRLSFNLILFIDLAVAVLGYVFTLRLLDTHIRSCNPLWYGWIATLVCYYPFWGILYPGLLGYSDGDNWEQWFAGMPTLLIVWGGLILVAKVFWIWANVTFGLRFSNLTHRGILTNGPFRFTKHPSYVAKNAAWWLISLPFLSQQGWQEALPNCIALLFVNAIYLVRARIEERHLMADPVYAAYAAWIEQNGFFARLRRYVPLGRALAAARRVS